MVIESIEADGQVLSLLRELGLSQNEAILLKFLVEKGPTTAVEMNKRLKIRQPQLYDILFSLERKGLINVIEGRPKVYENVDLETVIIQMEKDLEENRKFLANWAAKSKGKSSEAPGIWMSRTWRSFRNNTFAIMREAGDSIMIQSPIKFVPDIMEELDELDISGIRIFLLIYGNSFQKNDLDRILTKDYFTDVAIMDLGQFFVIIGDDDKSSFMPRNVMEKDKGERYGYIFRDKDMTWFIIHNFFVGWFEARMLKQSTGEDGTEYKNQRLALYDLTHLLKTEKKEVWVEVDAYDKEEKDWTTISGVVEGVITTNDIFSFTVRTRGGETFSIGGYDSKGERLEARKVKILQIK